MSAVAAVLAVVAALAALYVWRSGSGTTATDTTPSDDMDDGGDRGGAVVVVDEGDDGALVATTEPSDTAVAESPDTTVPKSAAATDASAVPPTSAPSTTSAPTTTATTTSTTTTAPPTTPAPTNPPTTPAPPPTPTTVPGDLMINGYTMFRPDCDGSYIVSVGSFPPTTPDQIRTALVRFPGTNYLRTDQTCPSLRYVFPEGAGSWAGEPIYMVVYGPFGSLATACDQQSAARSDQPDAYTKVLDVSTDIMAPNPCG